MQKQEVKIEYNGKAVFFFAHTFQTAMQHAEKFIERNKGKVEMRLFMLNESSFGERWRLIKKVPLVVKTQGQLDYEADVERKPTYHDGTPRKRWDELDDIARWSWERGETV